MLTVGVVAVDDDAGAEVCVAVEGPPPGACDDEMDGADDVCAGRDEVEGAADVCAKDDVDLVAEADTR